MTSKKVILTGSFGVGKTSLFNQFIYNRFSEKYLTTIGVKVNKKVIEVDGSEVSILLWDIAGEVSQDKVPTSYFLGASGIIYVIDLTRPSTYKNIKSDIDYLNQIVKGGITKIVANKKDLVTVEQIEGIAQEIVLPWDIVTSAKTGENVEELFQELGKGLLAG
ncbi:MAG: Rab family GTPase [Bacteroidota bacterium]